MRDYQKSASLLAKKICETYGYKLLSNLKATTSTGVFKIEAEGREWVLKLAKPGTTVRSEYLALKAWEATGKVPKAKQLSDQVLLIEYLEGQPITSYQQWGEEFGRILNTLHKTEPPELSFVQSRFPRYRKELEDCPFFSKQEKKHIFCSFEIVESDPTEKLIHGDLHIANLILTDEGYKLIDPYGYLGSPAYDLAMLIVNLPDSREEARADLLNGYEEIPQNFEHWLLAVAGIRTLNSWKFNNPLLENRYRYFKSLLGSGSSL